MSDWGVDHDACGVGLVAQMDGRASHEIVERGLEALLRLAHRGGVDADGRSGDGAGLLLPIPEGFFRAWAESAGLTLPAAFGIGMAFLPPDQAACARRRIEQLAASHGLRCFASRPVPTDASILGPRACATLPLIEQFFFAAGDGDGEDLESRLFRLRKHAEVAFPPEAYFCSLSSKTVVYKGLVTPDQLPAFYRDLSDPGFQCWFAIFHQRYSTNTQPSWALAQPFRFVAHNGEINTISANRRWLRARQKLWRQSLGLAGEARLLEPRVSDSASLDNAFELYLRQGCSPAEAALTLVPPAWENDGHCLPANLRNFLRAQTRRQEPWDGPAALVFTDGTAVGAKLDRNGLRPLRYTVTSDGLLVVGSEAGIADLHGKRVIERQRLGPGELLVLKGGKLLRPGQWPELQGDCEQHECERGAQVAVGPAPALTATPQRTRVMAALGWTEDRFRLLFQPLIQEGKEAVWSMGDDAPPAFLSQHRRPLWDYCKQRFAQVTNPAIDPLRERQVMSLEVYAGPDTVLPSPLLEFGQLQEFQEKVRTAARLDITFPAAEGVEGALAALQRIAEEASQAAGAGLVILTDRATSADRAPLPALLAAAAAWNAMVEAGGCEIPLVVESGQVFDTHHVALLVAAGAVAVLPWLALELAAESDKGVARLRAALENGLRKTMARMGVSTVASYRNSQLFEVVGLDAEVCERFFQDAHHALGGRSLRELLQDALDTHAAAFVSATGELRDAGLYRFRRQGETHGNSPEVVRRLHQHVKSPNQENQGGLAPSGEDGATCAIRDLLEIVPAAAPAARTHAESEASILSRFSTQAMSLGAISPEAHRTLALAMNRLGARSNTGEGGEDPRVYRNGGQANNRVKQVASARFGVTAEYLINADELEIKIAQGAKPGEGGQLPAGKVTPYIARLRHAVPNMTLISPPPHHDIYSIEDLAQLIYDLRAVNPHARIGVKLVSSGGVGMIASGVAKAGADVITISGHDGGTGAAALTSIKNTGLPWEVGLRDAHCSLLRAGLRGRVRLRVDGGLKFARDVIIAALLGAEEFGFGTAALLAIGCVMARQCHLNTCPVGIATQDEQLRTRFRGNPEMVMRYFRALAQDVQQLLMRLGAASIDEIVGAVERLRPRTPLAARALGNLLQPLEAPAQPACPREDPSQLHRQIHRTITGLGEPAARRRRFHIANCDRAIGAHLSGELLRNDGVTENTPARYEFVGTAGQSFGAFLASGVHFRLLGEANDYVGKGLSGGVIVVSHGPEASRRGDVLAGNTVLYGATAGELYLAGRAGERLAVRNSGALAVVEGTGRHCCEYMTAGVVLVLGPAGPNLGAGMTGGLAYVLRDVAGALAWNQESVRLAEIGMTEKRWLRRVLRNHVRLTGSPRAVALLGDFDLPLLRVEPLQPPCTLAETWSPILDRLHHHDSAVPFAAWPVPAHEPLPN